MSFNAHRPARITLDNGLTLIHQHRPHTGVVAIDVWVKAGAIYESDAWCGMAHFLEHMIFKGSERVQPGMFDQAVESHGGAANAGTGYDYAHYHMVMAQQHFADTLPYLADILVHATIPESSFESERQVVFEELRQCWDNPDYVAFQQLGEQLYPTHGYQRPILGTPETLAALSPETMRQFHRAFYQPDNMTIVVVGDLDQATTVDLIHQHFSDFAAPTAVITPPPQTAQAIVKHQHQDIHLSQIEESRLILSWLMPGWRTEVTQALHQGYCCDMLSVILASGRSSRLIQELLETQGLVYDLDANFSLQRDAGLFSITAWLPETKLATVESILHDHLGTIAETPVSEVELARAQRFLSNEAAFSTELPEPMAGIYGYYDMVGDLSAAWKYPDRINAISAAAIQQVAQTYLGFDQSLTTMVHTSD
ncbi:insulinase family protein [filamentous cyanobacterium LEGE 11480]|uniref:Insulinase family protein n=1 Tax=Romeriopsis navalis LEGE 11480 TaxID=2777977 RepID=A0A928VLU1_9CYAN|nr:pitrilysin family protein [Romeriopsis navalis]MBE9030921.1 insulinase family protein [Romeriopsis navalis LEGE 11480]